MGTLAALSLSALLMLLLVWILGGLVVGALSRWLIPGPTPMSWGKTFLYGIAGSFVGGLLGQLTGLSQSVPSLVFSVVGAVILILIFRGRG